MLRIIIWGIVKHAKLKLGKLNFDDEGGKQPRGGYRLRAEMEDDVVNMMQKEEYIRRFFSFISQ